MDAALLERVAAAPRNHAKPCGRVARSAVCAAVAERPALQRPAAPLPLPSTWQLDSQRLAVAPAALPAEVELAELSWPVGFASHYQLGKRIGTGSYGSCFVANDRVFGRSCCVKVIPKTRGKQRRDKVLRKIAAEADFLLRAQDSPNVVQLHAKYEDAANAYLCTELCTGGDLEQLVEERGPLSQRAVARVLLEVLKVVGTCHDSGFVHGDVKPANFVLKLHHADAVGALDSGRDLQGSWLKAIDFGCSQNVVGLAGLSRRTGTPVFMAAEVYQRDYSFPADLWSCGMLAYQLLSGRFPFWDSLKACQEATLDQVIEAVASAPIPIADAPWLPLSPAGQQLLAGLLCRDPAQRLTAQQALQHPWFAEQLGGAWAAQSAAVAAPTESFEEGSVRDASPAGAAVWQAAQQVAMRLFT